MKRHHLATLVLALVGASCSNGSEATRLPGYLTSDTCNDFGDEQSCVDGGCSWAGLESCPSDTICPEGVCYQPDPCNHHSDEGSCAADAANSCLWAAVELCAPDTDCSAGGFCYGGGGTDDCVCVCPLYCPDGEDCPPCDCSCPPPDDGGGGGTCTCACPDCAEGETCPPCDCTCEDPGTGCGGEGTCTCVCPVCPEGETCPPCDCDCDAGGGGSTETCVCPECPPDQTCPACECDPSEVPPSDPIADDPCLTHSDEPTCIDDTLNECSWIGLGIPCMEGIECVSGVCQGPATGDDDCTCVCPVCDAEPCPLSPCTCDCGGGSGCVEPSPA